VKQRGAATRSTFAAIEKLYGKTALSLVKEALPDHVRREVETVLAVQWYPVEVSAAIHVAIRDVIGKGSFQVSHRLGIEASKMDFTGIYRVLLRAVQYDTIWDRSERAWAHYNSRGEARWVDRRPGTATGRITGVTGFNLGIWNAVAGRTEGLLTLAGVRAVSVTVMEGTATHAILDATWIE